MGRKSVRRWLAAAAVLVLAATTSYVVVSRLTSSPRQSGEGQAASESGFPPALSAHLEKLARTIPGNGGESPEGPGAAGDTAVTALAYPDTDIPLARLDGARAAADTVKERNIENNENGGRPGTWTSVGPSQALYPFSDLRDLSSYVPNAYLAGGRTVAMAIAPDCRPGHCRMWIGPAGGGVWRTNNALAETPSWKYLTASFGINAIGAITLDPGDASANTLWVGTGEANTCSSGCVHGVGLFKSTDGGDTWTGPYGQGVFGGRGTGAIAVDPRNPNVLYVSSTMGLHGMSSVCCSGVSRIVIPGASLWGVYKSTDGGATWTFIHSGAATTAECGTDISRIAANSTPCTPRGVRQVLLDPSNPDIVYAASYARGVWRSRDAGATWTQIKPPLSSTISSTLPAIAVTRLGSGATRMYVAEGHTNAGGQYSRAFRSDRVDTGGPVWTDLTSNNPADPRWGTYNFCGGQCWYDNFVYTPKGYPDMVYLGGSYAYGEPDANHRGVVLSTDGGQSWTDMTADGTSAVHPNALHPDQHSLVTNPQNPFQFIEGSDGGVMRSSGRSTDVSSWCDSRGLSGARLARCKQMLSRVPSLLQSMNGGMTTLQFQSLSVSPFDSSELQGGTQDNGTWENYGDTERWNNTMIGDGGQSGFDVADPRFRFHTFYSASPDVNFSAGKMADWNWIADPIYGTEPQEFYVPMISDPKVSRTLFTGTGHVWRTKTAGMGTMSLDEFRRHCNEWTGDYTVQCGDWQPLGDPAPGGMLTSTAFGADRAGGDVVSVQRAAGDTSTLWAATSRGRLFVSHNADAEPASAVTFTRIDTLAGSAPNRFVSAVSLDPVNPNHAWVSYSGFSAATPSTPGHVFEVTYDPAGGTAAWASRELDRGDVPVTSLARDDRTGDLYAASDYGVMRLASGTQTWTPAASGMPNVEVAGLTILPAQRKLFAASHGLGAWSLTLP